VEYPDHWRTGYRLLDCWCTGPSNRKIAQTAEGEYCGQLAAVENIFTARLADSGVAIHKQLSSKLSSAVSFGKTLGLLANTELMHPSMRKQHETYLALLTESTVCASLPSGWIRY